MAVAMLAFNGYAAMAQSQVRLTSCDATSLLEKTIGKWQVNQSAWQSEKKDLATWAGRATYNSSGKGNNVHELCEIEMADGYTKTFDGYLRFVENQNQFEYVVADPATGKEEKLFVGEWFPEFNTLLLFSVRPKNTKLFKKYIPEQWRYVFFDNGTFSKMVHQPDENGKLILTHKYNYTAPVLADSK